MGYFSEELKNALEEELGIQVLEGRGYSGKFVSDDARLQWSDGEWSLEELPAKGKRKLRTATRTNRFYDLRFDVMMPENVLRVANLQKSDTYDTIKNKIENAMMAAYDAAEKKAGKSLMSLRGKWYEDSVHALKVVPEGTDPIEVKAKDFTFKAEWTKFTAYSPGSTMHYAPDGDPHYTAMDSKSAGAARKLYKMVQANPDLLANVSWNQFSDWLNKNKIGFDYHFSQWS